MLFSISYTEVIDYIEKNFNKRIKLERVSDKVLRISVTQKVILANVQVPVELEIDQVYPSSIAITYKGNAGVNFIISCALDGLKSKLSDADNFIVTGDDHNVLIELSKISRLESLFNKVNLDDIIFHDDRIEVAASFK